MKREYTLINNGAITLVVDHVAVPARGSAKVMLTLTRGQVNLFNMKNIDVVFTSPDGVRFLNDQCLELDRPVVETSTDKSDALYRMNMINHAVIRTPKLDAKIALAETGNLPAPEDEDVPVVTAAVAVTEDKTVSVLQSGLSATPTVVGGSATPVTSGTVVVSPENTEPLIQTSDEVVSARTAELDAMPWTDFKKLCKALKVENPGNALKRPALTLLVLEAETKKGA